jgi:hypothetical protein
MLRSLRRGKRQGDRRLERQSFGVRTLVIFTGILVLDFLTAVIAHPRNDRWLPTFTMLGAVIVIGSLVLISRLRRRRHVHRRRGSVCEGPPG